MDQLLGMRVFARVAELGSFARAADAMDLSRAMAQQLTSRSSKNTWAPACSTAPRARSSVSPEGAVYLEHCQRILAEVAGGR